MAPAQTLHSKLLLLAFLSRWRGVCGLHVNGADSLLQSGTSVAHGSQRPPRTPEEAAADFGGVQALCRHWGWHPLQPGARKPRIHYGTIIGNEGQADLYELHFVEVSPFVDRIVAVDPKMTQLGHPRNVSLDMSLPAFRRFGDQLRHVELENPIRNGKLVYSLSEEEFNALKRPGKDQPYRSLVIEQWQRAQMERGFKDSQGQWDIDENDVVVVTDSDEIPLRHYLAALRYCENDDFEAAKSMLDAGVDKRDACALGSTPMRLQVYEYFADCPVRKPDWLKPKVAMARCLINGAIDFEEVRTGRNFRTRLPYSAAGRHLHNVGMSNADIAFKYGHYAEPRVRGRDSGLVASENEEMAWRACSAMAPRIGRTAWHMSTRPSNDFLRIDNARGLFALMQSAAEHRGLDVAFAIEEERPELKGKLYWKGRAELRNPFVGSGAGPNSFH
mmetsp:Transcript_3860/g.10135  ORF Transcript_3860/g.10135 Transcript_3860/m.10135 type:complete len:445 (-) Transcript_3860:146-1480(-)